MEDDPIAALAQRFLATRGEWPRMGALAASQSQRGADECTPAAAAPADIVDLVTPSTVARKRRRDDAAARRLRRRLVDGGEDAVAEVRKELMPDAANEFEALHGALWKKALPEPVVNAAALCIITADQSTRRCAFFVEHALLPHARALTMSASRGFFQVVAQTVALHARAAVEGLLLPLLSSSDSGAPQIELVKRVLQQACPPEALRQFCDALLRRSAESAFWTPQTLPVLQVALLGGKTRPLDDDGAALFVSALQTNSSDELAKSAVFGGFLFQALKRFRTALAPHKEALRLVVEGIQSGIKAAAMREVNAF